MIRLCGSQVDLSSPQPVDRLKRAENLSNGNCEKCGERKKHDLCWCWMNCDFPKQKTIFFRNYSANLSDTCTREGAAEVWGSMEWEDAENFFLCKYFWREISKYLWREILLHFLSWYSTLAAVLYQPSLKKTSSFIISSSVSMFNRLTWPIIFIQSYLWVLINGGKKTFLMRGHPNEKSNMFKRSFLSKHRQT